MSSRKRKRRLPLSQSVKKRPLIDVIEEADLEISNIIKAFELCQYQQLPWAILKDDIGNIETASIEIPLTRDSELAAETETGENWYVFADLSYHGNLTGLPEMLTHQPQYPPCHVVLRFGTVIKLILHTRLKVNDKEQNVSIFTNLVPNTSINKEDIKDLYRLCRVGGAKLIFSLPACGTLSMTLTVSIVFGNIVMEGGAPDDIPMTSSGLIKHSLLQTLQPEAFTIFDNDNDSLLYHKVDQSLGSEVGEFVTCIIININIFSSRLYCFGIFSKD